jgi:hypothetical protein
MSMFVATLETEGTCPHLDGEGNSVTCGMRRDTSSGAYRKVTEPQGVGISSQNHLNILGNSNLSA